MRSRGLVVAIAVVLAVLAAVGVIVYTNQVRQEVTEQETVAVVVSNQDIPANTNLDPLIAQGAFDFVRVPEDALVAGAVTNPDDLQGVTTVAPIFAREQIPVSRLSSGDADLSLAGVTEGHVGITIELESPRGGGGIVQRGDSVAVFATFEKGTPVTRDSLDKLLTRQQIQQLFEIGTGEQLTGQQFANAKAFLLLQDVTVTLVPAVQVLSIQNPEIDEEGRTQSGTIQLSLDLLPEDARNLVFASELAQGVWVGLLPPQNAEEGYATPGQIGIDIGRLEGTTVVGEVVEP